MNDRDTVKAAFLSAMRSESSEAPREFAAEFDSSSDEYVTLYRLRALGEADMRDFEYVSAFQNMERALDLSKIHDTDGETSAVYQTLGNVHYFVGNYGQAHEAYLKAIELIEGDPSQRDRVARLESNIGNTLLYTDDYDQAESLYLKARKGAEDAEDKVATARAINNLALIALRKNDREGAVEFYKESIELLQEMGKEDDVTIVLANICEAMSNMRERDGLDEYMTELDARTKDNESVRTLFLNIRAGMEIDRGETEAAKKTSEESLEIAKRLGVTEPLMNAHQRSMEVAYELSDLDRYIEHRDEVDRLSEELRGVDARLRIAFQSKEHEVEQVRREHERERALLYGALPSSVADRLIAGEDVSGDQHEETSVLFLDIVDFTSVANSIPPKHLLHLLRSVFTICDGICESYGITKIKTIGDSYLAVAGIPEPRADHVNQAALAALEMMKALSELELNMDPSLGDTSWTKEVGDIQVRVGLHCGQIVAGIVGEQRLQYDVWGDTVNVASRMESSGEPGRIQVSEAFADAVQQTTTIDVTVAERGTIDIKGKGPMKTYWLEGA